MTPTVKHKYKKNYITQVIYQITFSQGLAVDDASMKRYKEALGDDYAELSTQEGRGVIISSEGSEITTEVAKSKIWQINSASDDHFIRVSPESFSITYKSYVKFSDYLPIVAKVQQEFFNIHRDVQDVRRMGLRYVNQIKLASGAVDWSQYINSNLVQPLLFNYEAEILRSMNSTIVSVDKETNITINHGIFNKYFPSKVIENEYILDIDAFTPTATELNRTMELLPKFNEDIAIYFERSITDNLRTEMEVIE